MVFSEKVKFPFRGLETDRLVGGRAILESLENAAGSHADSLGDGYSLEGGSGTVWLLLDWKLSVIRRPRYGEELLVTTWSHGMERCYGSRYFELLDGDGRITAAAASKWVLIDRASWSPARIGEEQAASYQSEPERPVCIDPTLTRLRPPESYELVTRCVPKRGDFDCLGHVHNTCYLDLAYEGLPESVYSLRPFDNIRISYKKEIRPGQSLLLGYSCRDGRHTVAITGEETGVLHAIIEME